MGVNISITNSKISDNAKVMNNANIKNHSSETKVTMDNVEITGNAEVLEKLCIDDIDEIRTELKSKILTMDKSSKEYLELKNLIENKDKGTFHENMKKHIGNFANGVLQQIVANYLMMKR